MKILSFLINKMRMTGIYQPVIIKHLLLKGGTCSVNELANTLTKYDAGVIEYYEKIVMRYPKQTLTKHGVVEYDRKEKSFKLLDMPSTKAELKESLDICDEKINEWLHNREMENDPDATPSLRYEVLRKAKGKCELCGIPSSLAPLEVDHIVPRSTAKNGLVKKDGKMIPLNSEENLQALCFRCNRAKRDSDSTDFRTRKKLVRDNIPAMIEAEGRIPHVKELTGKNLWSALCDKLVEEHAEFLEDGDVSELGDMIEVITALAEQKGVTQQELLAIVEEKRMKNGGFERGYFYAGDKQ